MTQKPKKNSKKFCLLGHKIEYSLSPKIHNSIFQREGINAIYELVDIPQNNISKDLFNNLVSNYNGMNVTIPFKRDVIKFVNNVCEPSMLTGSVNTIDVDSDGVTTGYNTDIVGIRKGFFEVVSRKTLQPSRLVILGGGGAARSMIYSFLECHSRIKSENRKEIFMFLRNPTKGKDLEEMMYSIQDHFHLRRMDAELRVYRWDNEKICEMLKYGGIIVNATPRGSLNSPDRVAFDFEKNKIDGNGVIAFDMVYNPSETIFLQTAIKSDVMAIGGMGMLVYQALESLKIWFKRDDFVPGTIFDFLHNI